MSRLAALDLGTNSSRFLCVDSGVDRIRPDTIQGRDTRITRLGEGVDDSGVIAESAVNRVLKAVRDFDRTVEALGGTWVGGIGTSACRRASDSSVEELFEELGSLLGVRPEIIDGRREAELTHQGVRASLPPNEGTIVDIGGGSTEWIPFDDEGLISARSFNVGVVTLNERCVDPERYTREAVDCMDDEIEERLPENLTGPTPLITVGGTGTTLSPMMMKLDQYDPARVHGSRIQRDDVAEFRRTMRDRTFEELGQEPMIQPGREDVILPGVLILDAALEVLEGRETVVSDLGVLTGYLSEWIDS
jgi:exopolyphosphatase/guanosine-5'-triphosphate,3'-diphosphate pyrophosphatase